MQRRLVEAARAYADISSQKKLARAAGLDPSYLTRRLSGRYPWKPGDLLAIARATGVPEWFLEHGWEGANRADVMAAIEETEAAQHAKRERSVGRAPARGPREEVP